MDGPLDSSTFEAVGDPLTEQLHLDGNPSRTPRYPRNWNFHPTSSRDESSALPIQRYELQEPQREPWIPVPTAGARFRQSRPASTFTPRSANYTVGRRQSIAESHDKTVDSGYYSASQPDLVSAYSIRTAQLQVNPASSSLAGNFSVSGPGPNLQADQSAMVGQEQDATEPAAANPLRCTWPNCEKKFVGKTKSDLK